jgi:trigger factor
MNCQLLEQEKNQVKIEVVVPQEDFNKYVEQAYKKTRGKFSIQGFRKGKAPRRIIESNYGEGVFYDEALNILLPVEYDKAITELELTPVDRPEVDIVEIGKDVDLKFTAEVDVKPEVVLGDYKGLEVKKPSVEVTDEMIDEEMKKSAEMNARMIVVEDRAVEDGDILTIDYKGMIGEEQFEGGTAENQALTIGAGEFIPGFEEQLIGKNTNEETKVEVTFPEDYHSEELAGKAAIFEVKIHEIKVKELPELDDEFAQDTTEFDTLAEYRADLTKNMVEANEKSAKDFIRNSLVEQAAGNIEIEIPNGMIESETDFMLRDMEYQLSYSGIQMEQYLQITGSTVEDLKEQMKEDALVRVKTQLVLEKISEVEALEVTQEDIDKEIERIAEAQNQTAEEVKKIYARDDYSYLKDSMKSTKVVDLLEENAKIVE